LQVLSDHLGARSLNHIAADCGLSATRGPARRFSSHCPPTRKSNDRLLRPIENR
jgi:hypothetical protein